MSGGASGVMVAAVALPDRVSFSVAALAQLSFRERSHAWFTRVDRPPVPVPPARPSGIALRAEPKARAGCTRPCEVEAKARPTGRKPIPSHWVVHACALQMYAEGRGPYPLRSPSKKYEPIPILWSELPSELREALERVAEALSWPRRLGEAGPERLVRLNQLYKRWTKGRATSAPLISEAEGFVSFVEAAPRPNIVGAPASVQTRPETSSAVATDLMNAVRRHTQKAPARIRERLELEASLEALDGRFDATDSLETRAKRAVWRVESRLRTEKAFITKIVCRQKGGFDSVYG